jgi:hypothetical protein
MSAELTADELNEYDAETVLLTDAAEQRIAEAEAEAGRLASEARAAKKRAKAEAGELRRMIRERADNRGQKRATLLDMVSPATSTAGAWRATLIKDSPLSDGIKAFLSFEPVRTLGELHDEIAAVTPDGGAPFGLAMGDLAEVRMKLAELADREAPDPAAIPEELWREYPIERWTRFGLTAKDVEKLAAGEVKRESDRRPVRTVGDLSNFSAPTSGGYSRQYADIKGIGTAGADRLSDAETRFWQWWQCDGQDEFARERGVIPSIRVTTELLTGDAAEPYRRVLEKASGHASNAGRGSEGDRGGDPGEAAADHYAEAGGEG